MKAVVYQKQGKKPLLVYKDIEKPSPKANEVLIRVNAVSLNAADYRSMEMGFIPKNKIFGADVAGTIDQVGANCHTFKVGDHVFGDLSGSGFGGLAEYVVAYEKAIALIPDVISFDEAAAIPMASLTALQALRDLGRIQANQSILIYGAGGGVGTFAVQIAYYFKARITAICGPANVGLMKRLGAEHVIDYQKEDVTKHPLKYDHVLAINGHQKLSTYRAFLKKKGVLVVVGGSLSQIIKTLIFGFFLSLSNKKTILLRCKPNQDDLKLMAKLVSQGHVKPVIERRVTLEEAPAALNHLTNRHAKGKTIVRV